MHTVWGRTTCPYGNKWKQIYSGYAMSTHYTQAASKTICVDKKRDSHAQSSNANHNGNLLYTTEFHGQMDALHNKGFEVTCVVCGTTA